VDRLVLLWCPELSREGPRSEEMRAFAEILEIVAERCPFVLPIRLGMAAFPARAPSRFFGGEDAVISLLHEDLSEVLAASGSSLRCGVADGLFAAVLAARDELIVPAGQTVEFIAPFSIATLRREEMAGVCRRLGLTTLGRFAALSEDRVLERFGSDGAHCHRVARGEEGELLGIRDPRIQDRLRLLVEPPPPPPQPSFFGGTSLVDERASLAAIRLQQRLGPNEVKVARILEGHDPAERATLVPFGSTGTLESLVGDPAAPWPGQVPAPSPTTVLQTPTAVVLTDPAGHPVEVNARGLLSAVPGRCLLGGGAPVEEVVAWAGPWPLSTRWWDRRRWRARLQVLTASGAGFLLGSERGRWWLLGRYD